MITRYALATFGLAEQNSLAIWFSVDVNTVAVLGE